jgi:uncharacterized membrane protein
VSAPRRPDDPPAWPLGCLTALLGLFLSVNIVGLLGILFATAGLPPWLARAGPLIAGLTVPVLMVIGWAAARRRNPYAARVMLWGIAFTLVALAVATATFDWIDRLNGL